MSALPPDGTDPVSRTLARRLTVPALVLLAGGAFLYLVYTAVR